MLDAIWHAAAPLVQALATAVQAAYSALGKLGPALLGLFGGAGATLLWELGLKPGRERRNIARVLLAENSHNLTVMVTAAEIAKDKSELGRSQGVPQDFAVSTVAFDALAAQLGELPAQIVREMVFLRAYYRSLNDAPALFASACEIPLDGPTGVQNRLWAQNRNLVIFRQTLDKAIHRVGLVQPLLAQAGYSRWTREGRAERRGRLLDVNSLRARIARNEAERDKYSGPL